jgi:hypothetical protein
MPGEGESHSQTAMMKQINYTTFPLHHAASDQEEAPSQGEGRQSLEAVALLVERYRHQGPHLEEAAPAPPA